VHEVITSGLWIGNARDARDPRALYEHGIAAVVDLAYDEPPAALPRDFVYCRIPLVDGGGNARERLRFAIETVEQLLASKTPTLVACGAGMSRSPCVVALTIAQQRGESPEAVLTWLADNHPHDVSLALWYDAIQACSSD
jgi:protein-tyrosine phosphatase